MGYGAALGPAAGQLLSKQVEKLGLDEFAVHPSGSVLGTAGLTTVRMGKYFSRVPFSLWVRYEAPVSDMSTGQVELEHRIMKGLTLSGMSNSAHDLYGVGLGLKRKF